MLVASITDPIVNFAVDVVREMGLLGVFLLMVGESACLPIPSEATMLFAGFNVAEGEYSLFMATFVGVAANVVGSWIAYGDRLLRPRRPDREARPQGLHQAAPPEVGRRLVREVRRRDRVLLAHAADHPDVHLAARGRRADAVLALHVLTALGCIPWVFMLVFIGKQAGDRWESWKDNLHYIDYAVVAAIVLGAIWLFMRYRRRRSEGDAPAADASSA